MNRRTFLSHTSAAMAAVAMTASAAEDRTPIRCGMLGVDHSHAPDVLEQIRTLPDYELVGICEPNDAVRAAFQDNPAYKDVRWLSQQELLGDDTIRMVAVESYTQRLLELGRSVIDAGKHLHIDKPPGTSLPEWRALLDEAGRRDLIVQLGYMFRYNPGFDFIRRAVGEGWLGEVYSIDASMCTSLSREKRERIAFHPGGVMLELGCHLIDMIVLILGEPKEVTPFLRHDGPVEDGLADNCVAVLEYDGARALVMTAAMEPDAFVNRRFSMVGTFGKIILEPLEPPAIRMRLTEPKGGYDRGWHEVPLVDLPRHRKDLQDLAACIRGESVFSYSRVHDYAAHRTVLRACGESD